MTTYYVDASSGNDGASGTSKSQAWRSINKVNFASLNSGDTVLFKGGQTFGGELKVYGKTGVTFSSYDGTAHLTTGVYAQDSRNLTFNNLEISGGDSGIQTYRVTNSTFTNLNIHNNQEMGIFFLGNSSNNTISNSQFHHNGGGNVGSGVQINDGSSNNVVSNVRSFNNAEHGVQFGTGSGSNNVIRGSHLYNNGETGFTNKSGNNAIENSVIENNPSAGINLTRGAATVRVSGNDVQSPRLGIEVEHGRVISNGNYYESNQYHPVVVNGTASDGNTFTNDVINSFSRDYPNAILFWGGANHVVSNSAIISNTQVYDRGGSVYVGGGARNVTVKDSAIYTNTGLAARDLTGATNLKLENNDLWRADNPNGELVSYGGQYFNAQAIRNDDLGRATGTGWNEEVVPLNPNALANGNFSSTPAPASPPPAVSPPPPVAEPSSPPPSSPPQAPGTGTNGPDNISGTNGDDTIRGLGGNDRFLRGHGGNDKIYGGPGNDEMNGGTGTNELYGEAGDDVYWHDLADGVNHVYENSGQGFDIVRFWDAPRNQVGFRRSGDDLILTLRGKEAVVIHDYAGGGTIEKIEGQQHGWSIAKAEIDAFFNGETASPPASPPASQPASPPANTPDEAVPPPPATGGLDGTGGNDNISGTNGNDTIRGFGGNDRFLRGRGGNDEIYGGPGNDEMNGGAGTNQLHGEAGDDVYWHDLADGVNHVYENSGQGYDTVRFWDATRDQVGFRRDGDDLILTLRGKDAVIVHDYAGGGTIEKIEGQIHGWTLSKGEVDALFNGAPSSPPASPPAAASPPPANTPEEAVSPASPPAAALPPPASNGNVIEGTAGNDNISGTNAAETIDGKGGNDRFLRGRGGDDIISGSAGNDEMNGGAGTNQLYGGFGNDIYWHDIVDGLNHVHEEPGQGYDVLRFWDAQRGQVDARLQGKDAVFTVNGEDAVVVHNYADGGTIEKVEGFMHGWTLSKDQLDDIIGL